MSWWGGNEVHRAYLASIRRFEEKYPHIKVKGEYTGWVGHLERLTTQIAGGTAPDVMQVNCNWLVLFSTDGRGFYDLNRVGNTLDLTQFDAEARSIGTVHGRLNADPRDTAEMAALYDRLVREHVIAPAPERASYGNVPEQELRPWITGKYAGLYYWTSAVGKLVETLEPGQKIVLAPYFMRPGARDAGLSYRPGMMIAMNSQTEHPREAALLIDFIFNDPFAIEAFGLQRGLPVSKSAVALLKSKGTPRTLGWEGNEQIALLPHSTGESGYFEHPRVRDAFFDILEAQGFGEIDAAESGRRMYTDINRVLQRVIRPPAMSAQLGSGGRDGG
jgi:ABC-type glycerol-3-phosphate transport system substrate-binding protein